MTAADVPSIAGLPRQLAQLDAAQPAYATRFVELLLQAAAAASASDVHLQPTAAGLKIRWRLDGVLQLVGEFPRGSATDVVTRLKVLAELLTYRQDIPQEGRIRQRQAAVEMRVSTFPTLHGERAVVRLFAAGEQFARVADLGFPAEIAERLRQLLVETSGAVLFTGPAGSGKTTSVYACLREIAACSQGRRSIVTIEDPIETPLDGVSQSQVNPAAGFDLVTGLKSLLRQDPEVIVVGEVRDPDTAATVFQASLTGHLVLSTFHAGSAAEATQRLADMGIEPYPLRAGLLAVLNQRLLRRLCECAAAVERPDDFLGLPVTMAKSEVGCAACLNSGYRGRMPIVELLEASQDAVGRAIFSRADAAEFARLARESGMIDRSQRAIAAVSAGETSPAEVRRVLGFADGFAASIG